MNYSIIYEGIAEDKKTFYYRSSCDLIKKVHLFVYNHFLDFLEHQEIIEVHPNITYWTALNSSNQERYVKFVDLETYETVALFGLQGTLKMGNYNVGEYSKKILPFLNDEERYCLSATFNEIFIDKVYKNDFVFVEENDFVIDIGFNFGNFTFSSLYKNPKKIIGFDPNKKLVDLFKNNFIDDRVELENLAVSDYGGMAEFYNVRNPGLSSIEENIYFINERSNNYVKVVNFYEYLKSNDIKNIDFIKIDCEGSEFNIINSLPIPFLESNIKKMIIEYHDFINTQKVQNLIDKLKNTGFKLQINGGVEKPIGMIYAKK